MSMREMNLKTQTLGAALTSSFDNIKELYEVVEGLVNSVQTLSLGKGTRGVYVKVGILVNYVLGECSIENIEPESYITLDQIPKGFIPAITQNSIAVLGSSPRIEDSLLLCFDRVSGTIKLVNKASNRVKNIRLLSSSYSYVASSSAYDSTAESEVEAGEGVVWEELDTEKNESEQATVTVPWQSTET